MNVILNQNQVYYYEDKPYRVLHEGKLKVSSVGSKMIKLFGQHADDKQEKEFNEDLMKVNNGSKWIDVVIYEPLYEECDIRICVKEKDDFYNNYKTKQ